jgi:hypothetical protein
VVTGAECAATAIAVASREAATVENICKDQPRRTRDGMTMSATPPSEALYSERIVWAPSYPLAAVLAIVGATQLFDQWLVGVILLGAAALVMWFCVARYTITRDGVDVHVGLGRPHLHIAATDIASVDPTRISMLAGWGYRGSWTMLGNVAISLGGNGAVLITTRQGKRLQLASRHPNDLVNATACLIE